MTPRVARLHRIVGIAGVLAFLVSGLYMHYGLGHLRALDDATRLLYRSRHIYLLLTSLVNLAFGLAASGAGRPRASGRIGSWLMISAPPLAIAAFLTEPHLEDLAKPITQIGMIAVFAGTLLHLVDHLRAVRRADPPAP